MPTMAIGSRGAYFSDAGTTIFEYAGHKLRIGAAHDAVPGVVQSGQESALAAQIVRQLLARHPVRHVAAWLCVHPATGRLRPVAAPGPCSALLLEGQADE